MTERANDHEMMMEKAKKLADAHWSYVRDMLLAHDEDSDIIEKCGFHYRTAFIHGFKHGVEDDR